MPRFIVVDGLTVERAADVARIAAEVTDIADGRFTIHCEGLAPSRTELKEGWAEVRAAPREQRRARARESDASIHEEAG